MSARNVNKLRLEREAEAAKKLAAVQEGANAHSDDEEDQVLAPSRNAFAFFSDSDDSSSSSDNESENENEKDISTAQASLTASKPPAAPVIQNRKKDNDVKDDTNDADEVDEDDMVLQKAMDRAAAEQAAASSALQDDETSAARRIFSVEKRDLNPEHELRRQLGRALREANEHHHHRDNTNSRQQSRGGQHARGGRGRGGGGRVRTTRQLNQSLFFSADENEGNWIAPPTFHSGAGARMTQQQQHGTHSSYSFEASEMYQALQHRFLICRDSHDPNQIVELLNDEPFHVDALLQMSDVYMGMSNFESSELMLKRALFSMEAWMHPSFRAAVVSGSARIQIDELESLSVAGLNFALLHALFRSMQLSSRRGCHSTAASLANVVVGLCPDQDPKRVLLCIDYFAIKEGRTKWMLDFLSGSKKEEEDINNDEYEFLQGLVKRSDLLPLLFPNLAFSLAMAACMEASERANQQATGGRSMIEEQDNSTVAKDIEAATDMLKVAVMRFPGAALELMQRAVTTGIVTEESTSSSPVWAAGLAWCKRAEGAVTQSGWDSRERVRLYKLYSIRSLVLWKVSVTCTSSSSSSASSSAVPTKRTLLAWLAEVVGGVSLSIVDNADVSKAMKQREREDVALANASGLDEEGLKEARVLVSEFYGSAPLSDFTDDIASIPALTEEVNHAAAGGGRRANEPNVDMDSSAVRLFFETMMPWARLPGSRSDNDQQNDGNGNGGT